MSACGGGGRRGDSHAAGGFARLAADACVFEKAHYPFKNYRHACSDSVLFVGCSAISLYPRTVDMAVRVLGDAAGVGVAYDCCGAPVVAEGSRDAARVTKGVRRRLASRGVREVVVMCPTCGVHLGEHADLRVVSVYAKLRELGLGARLPDDGAVFPPCPDRKSARWLDDVLWFFEGAPPVLKRAPCCGLGAGGGYRNPQAMRSMAARAVSRCRQAAQGAPYVYCPSCAGSFARNGCEEVRYVLSEILGVGESPQVALSLVNRAKSKLR